MSHSTRLLLATGIITTSMLISSPSDAFWGAISAVIHPDKQLDVITGKESVSNAAKESQERNGKVLEAGADAYSTVNHATHQVIVDTGTAVGGDTGTVIAEVTTTQSRFSNEVAATEIKGAGRTLQGENPFETLAGPLAAAIRDARNKYANIAQPIPENIKIEIRKRNLVPESILEKARYTTDNLRITLPNIINTGNTILGNSHAVTVDNIIVFNEAPGNNLRWWAHELRHVFQYDNLGIDKFAWRYARDGGKQLEADAEQAEALL